MKRKTLFGLILLALSFWIPLGAFALLTGAWIPILIGWCLFVSFGVIVGIAADLIG